MFFQIQDSLNVNMHLWGKKKKNSHINRDLFEWKLEENAGLNLNKQCFKLKTLVKCCNKRKNCFLAA